MMSLTFGLFTQVSGSGPLGPLVFTARLSFPLDRWPKPGSNWQPTENILHHNGVTLTTQGSHSPFWDGARAFTI